MSDHVFELVKAQIAHRFGREPRTTAEMSDALSLLDPPLVGALAARLEIKKALGRPLLDFATFGGNRAGAVPVGDGGSDDDLMDRAGQALAELSGKMLGASRRDVETARRDFAHRSGGGTFAKRGVSAGDLADYIQQLADALHRPVDY